LTISGGTYGIFFTSTAAKILWVIIIALLIQPLLSHFKSKNIENIPS